MSLQSEHCLGIHVFYIVQVEVQVQRIHKYMDSFLIIITAPLARLETKLQNNTCQCHRPRNNRMNVWGH